MPNVNKPSGLSPVKYLNGADWDGRVNIYSIAAANTNAFYVGDPVVPSGDADTLGIMGVTVLTPGTGPIVGVIAAIGVNPDGGPYIDPNNLSRTFRPSGAASSVYYVAVCDDPNVIYECQEVGTGTAFTSAEVGLNCNLVLAAPATGAVYSGAQLNNATEATTSSLDVKLLGLARKAGNAFGAYAKWNVLINNHAYRAGITGV